jgi:hypothetical protein
MKIRTVLALVLCTVYFANNDIAYSAEKRDHAATEPIPIADPIQKGRTVWGLAAGYGVAHEIAYSSPDHQFFALGGRFGGVVTEPRGPGFLKGNLEVTLEALPVFVHYDDDPDYGASFTLLLRQYLSPGSRWRPFLSIGAGALVSTKKVPENTSRVNFTPQGGIGLAMAYSYRTIFTVEYRYHHISNADTADLNPGINSSSFHFSVNMFR